MTKTLLACCVSFVLLWAGLLLAADGPESPRAGGIIDLPHLRDPLLEPAAPTQVLDPRLQTLWIASLLRDDEGLKLDALHAFAQAAHRTGERFSDEARQRIVEHIDPAKPLAVAIAAVEAAATLDERSAADRVMTLVQASLNVQAIPICDRALAAWDHAPARAMWRQRAIDREPSHEVRRSAIQSLGRVGDGEAVTLLTTLAADRTESVSLRLEAAAALGRFVPRGLSDPAAALDDADALLAAVMLRSHDDEAALSHLAHLAGHADPAVAAEAAGQLADRAPGRLDLALASHEDALVRLAVTRAAAAEASPRTAAVLADRLDDPSVRVRRLARDTLIGWARTQPQLQEAVWSQVDRVWAEAGWRGREQAALIAGWTDHRSMAQPLAAAMADERGEVRLAVCGALRLLEAASTAPAMRQRVEQLLQSIAPGTDAPDPSLVLHADAELTQLFLALGRLKHREAEPLYRQVIPKGSVPASEARAAAVYVLGCWYEGGREADLERQFVERMTDASIFDPESPRVQTMCAVALGRMGAVEQADNLRAAATNPMATGGTTVQLAAAWALEKLTGERLEKPAAAAGTITGWFLEPAD